MVKNLDTIYNTIVVVETAVITVFPYVLTVVGVLILLWWLLRLGEKAINQWVKAADNPAYVEKVSLERELTREQAARQKEVAQLQTQLEQAEWSKKKYHHELEKVLRQYKEVKENYEYTQATAKKSVQIREIPVLQSGTVYSKEEMKAQLKRVIHKVDHTSSTEVYQRALDYFEERLMNERIHCALPYKVILRLFEIYDEHTMQIFAHSFNKFIGFMKQAKIKKIYQSRYYTNEQKLRLFYDEGLLDYLDDEFVQFLFYMLEHYTYRRVRSLYQHFEKVYDLVYYKGTVGIEVVNQEEIGEFRRFWELKFARYSAEYRINSELKKGVRIHFSNFTIDMSYAVLLDYYIDQYGMEVEN